MKYLHDNWRTVLARFGEHLSLTVTALLIALVIAVPIGVLIAGRRRVEGPVIGLLSVIYTIPSLALLVLLIPIVGLGRTDALIVLVVYAQVILVRNIVVGLAGVDPALREAARGMGMNVWQRLMRVEIPLALPVIIAGIRIATVAIIGIGTIAALVHGGGLGDILLQGVQRDYPQMILTGALAAATLAALANSFFKWAEQRARSYIDGDGER